MTTREKLGYRDRTELDENLDYRDRTELDENLDYRDRTELDENLDYRDRTSITGTEPSWMRTSITGTEPSWMRTSITGTESWMRTSNRDEEGNEEHQTEHPNSSYQAANQHMVKFNDELKVINEQTSLDFEFRKNPAEYDLAERSLTPVLVDGLDPVSVVSNVLYRIVGVGGRRRSRVRHQLIEVALGVVVAVAPEDHVPGDAVVAGVVPGERHLVMGSRGVQAGGLGRYRHLQGFDVEPAGPLAHPRTR